METEKIIFYIFATIMVASATMVITIRNPVKAALFLVLAFFASAAIWIMLEAEFLAIVLVLVYVGAVMVLFLFVVMMLDINLARLKEGFISYLPVGITVAVAMATIMVLTVGSRYFGQDRVPAPVPAGPEYNNTRELGEILYTVYVYPFEIASVILLLAIVAAIALTLRKRPDSKYQKPEEQIAVKRSERVRLVSMSVEKRK